MEKLIKVIEYQYVIKAKFNPVKFNNLRPQITADQTSKVMTKISKKTIIAAVAITLLLIAVIIFIVFRNKKKKKKLEEEEKKKLSPAQQTKPVRQQSTVIPKEDRTGAQPTKTPVAVTKPAPATAQNGQSIPAPIPNTIPADAITPNPEVPFSPFVEAKPVAEAKPAAAPITPLKDKGISIEAELNKPIDQD